MYWKLSGSRGTLGSNKMKHPIMIEFTTQSLRKCCSHGVVGRRLVNHVRQIVSLETTKLSKHPCSLLVKQATPWLLIILNPPEFFQSLLSGYLLPWVMTQGSIAYSGLLVGSNRILVFLQWLLLDWTLQIFNSNVYAAAHASHVGSWKEIEQVADTDTSMFIGNK
jgi:hypothetical protein